MTEYGDNYLKQHRVAHQVIIEGGFADSRFNKPVQVRQNPVGIGRPLKALAQSGNELFRPTELPELRRNPISARVCFSEPSASAKRPAGKSSAVMSCLTSLPGIGGKNLITTKVRKEG